MLVQWLVLFENQLNWRNFWINNNNNKKYLHTEVNIYVYFHVIQVAYNYVARFYTFRK